MIHCNKSCMKEVFLSLSDYLIVLYSPFLEMTGDDNVPM